MLPNREERVGRLNNPQEGWDAIGVLPQIKIGDNTEVFIAADADEEILQARMKTVGFSYTPNLTQISPGASLRHNIDARLVSYNGHGFHPQITDQPPTSVNPYIPMPPNITYDPNIEMLMNLFSILQSLAGVI